MCSPLLPAVLPCAHRFNLSLGEAVFDLFSRVLGGLPLLPGRSQVLALDSSCGSDLPSSPVDVFHRDQRLPCLEAGVTMSFFGYPALSQPLIQLGFLGRVLSSFCSPNYDIIVPLRNLWNIASCEPVGYAQTRSSRTCHATVEANPDKQRLEQNRSFFGD